MTHLRRDWIRKMKNGSEAEITGRLGPEKLAGWVASL